MKLQHLAIGIKVDERLPTIALSAQLKNLIFVGVVRG